MATSSPSSPSARRTLSERERLFVEAYMGRATGNATAAATCAGYSAKTACQIGSRLLTRVQVRAAIDAYQVKLARPTIADAVERREVLTDLLRVDTNGLIRIKAADVLNKMDGLYVQKMQHTGHDGGPIRTAPDDQLDQRIAELERRLRR